MKTLLFSMASLIVGYFLATIKNWFFEEKKRKKKANCLAIEIVCMLKMFIDGCVEVGSVAKNKITLLHTIIRFNFSQRRSACSTKNGTIF